ncbi:type II secretion system minor pseudopilin GspJ [Stenotrophomonas sp.]|uniref:type II secretion system minor pseudopilin GspJ n=1 Tax=Stenotrophomonas sp. TaxID=69392 RepID=UPI0028AB410F|nr:type II secretion system minor pseudopilin GspJ [Stenotrophomonas sp.]
MRRSAGFTLLEVLVAVAIFALVGVASHRLLVSTVRVDAQTRTQDAQLRQLQRAVTSLERDVEQALERPVLDATGGNEPAFWSDADGQGLQWTRGGWNNPLGNTRAQLQRVRWYYQDGALRRQYWPVLDRADDSPPQSQLALPDVTAVQWRYLDRQGVWRTQWQGAGQALPRALEVRIDHARFGVVRRVLLLPEGGSWNLQP